MCDCVALLLSIHTLSSQAYNLPFLQILTTVAFLFFFRTDSTDSTECLVFTDTYSEHIRFLVFSCSLLYLF